MPDILIVDDEAYISTQVKEHLLSIGYDVVGMASSGQAAIEMAKSLHPDLILMDIVLPGKLDGIAAARIIKEEQDIPVIFLTAYTDDKLIERAKNVEPFGYIVKPFQEREIKAAIEVALYKKEMEEALQRAHDDLERRVEERTEELAKANEELQAEITERNQAEQALREREKELEIKTNSLEEVNAALRVLLKGRDEDRTELEEKVLFNVKELVVPFLERLKKSQLDPKQLSYIDILETNLNNIISPFSHTLSTKYLSLTPKEIQIANLIKEGKSTKEIGEVMVLSPRTIETHRKNMRKKLGLEKKKENLRSHLLTFQ
ncbi:response regulator [Candidatus Aerophobetes bacterium]|uniref:Response regulator n=1 Tax=Aerophobetes bacterium TaxID=2030807 RepID=A0A523QHD3_UNCAE|nr:MAG: response regulator [Candidatus Aerophobetes bacterium]